MKKTFRGKMADGEVKRVRLSTNNGLTGYRIVNFQLLPLSPGASTQEIVGQVFTTQNDESGQPRSASTSVNFDDPTLVSAAVYNQNGDSWSSFETVIFDSMTFNQDIFVTIDDSQNVAGANFYLELEQVTLSKDEATVATLKDMRAGPDTNFGP